MIADICECFFTFPESTLDSGGVAEPRAKLTLLPGHLDVHAAGADAAQFLCQRFHQVFVVGRRLMTEVDLTKSWNYGRCQWRT